MADQPDRSQNQAEPKAGAADSAEIEDRTIPVGTSSGGRVAATHQTDATAAVAATVERPEGRDPRSPPASGRKSFDDATVIVAPQALGTHDPTVVVPPPLGRPRVIVTDATGATQEHPMTRAEITIGRATECNIILSAPTVSRLHARITRVGGDCMLVPLGSQRNTYVNRELVTQPRLLRDGDTIRLATEQMVYRVAEDATMTLRRLALGLFGAAAVVGIAVFSYSAFDRRQPGDQEILPVADRAPPGGDAAADAAVGDAQDGAESPQPAEDPEAEPEGRAEPAAARERETLVAKLVYEGDIAFLERRYTTPPNGSAVYAYREALNLDPTNERALEQTAAIIDDYLRWADTALTAGNLVRARIFVEKAEYVHEQIPMAGDAEAITARATALQRRLHVD